MYCGKVLLAFFANVRLERLGIDGIEFEKRLEYSNVNDFERSCKFIGRDIFAKVKITYRNRKFFSLLDNKSSRLSCTVCSF